MPPKCRFTRLEILNAALEIARVEGTGGVTARSVAARLHSSPKVIFGLFRNMDELQEELIRAADAMYQRYLQEEIKKAEYPPYKATGLAYIRFAKEERELFRLLFMRDRSQEAKPQDSKELQPILSLIQKSTGLTEQDALMLHLEMWMYTHGIATTIATSYCQWELPLISQMLTDAFEGLKYRFCGKETGYASHQTGGTDKNL